MPPGKPAENCTLRCKCFGRTSHVNARAGRHFLAAPEAGLGATAGPGLGAGLGDTGGAAFCTGLGDTGGGGDLTADPTLSVDGVRVVAAGVRVVAGTRGPVLAVLRAPVLDTDDTEPAGLGDRGDSAPDGDGGGRAALPTGVRGLLPVEPVRSRAAPSSSPPLPLRDTGLRAVDVNPSASVTGFFLPGASGSGSPKSRYRPSDSCPDFSAELMAALILKDVELR